MNAYSMDYWAFFYKKTDPHTGTFRLRFKCEARGDGARGKIGHNDTMCCGEGRKKIQENEATVKKMGLKLLFFVFLS